MRAAALAVDAAEVRDMSDGGTGRFVVRFTRNSFGWGGRGVLSATNEALRFTARRAGLIGYLLPRVTSVVPSNRIASVLREADGIRLQFRGDGPATTHALEFSAGSSLLAASIVRYLPTALTVELEQPARAAGPAGLRRRIDLRRVVPALLAIGVVAGYLAMRDEPATVPTPAGQPEALPTLPLEQRMLEVTPVPVEALLAARIELRAAEERTVKLKQRFGADLRHLMEGDVTQADFANMLDRELIPQWRRETGVLSARHLPLATQLDVLELMNRSANLWASGLTRYVEGLREQQPEKVLQAFELVGRAEALETQAYDLVRRAENRAASAADAQP